MSMINSIRQLVGILQKLGLTQRRLKLTLKKLKHPKVVALGEITLDYHWMTARQRRCRSRFFAVRFQLSKDLDLPFVVHTRDALEDTYEIIKSEGVGPRGGIMHSFSGTLWWAEKFVALGMTISFSGW